MRHFLLFKSRILIAGLVLALAACQQETATPPAAQASSPAPAVTPAAAAGSHTFGPEISAEDFAAHIKTLASDEFGGRAPGSEGEKLTVAYLIEQMQRLGLQPGNQGNWTQKVPMEETDTPAETVKIAAKADDQTLNFAYGTEAVIGSRQGKPEVAVADSDMIFVGYGVNAPEMRWNDYAGLDVKGKTVVMLVNDPGFHVGDETLFQGKRMVYYGRWVYKFEEAARQGAAAALIIHDDAGAGYPWSVVQSSWTGPQFELPAATDPHPRLPLEGWLTQDSAVKLFKQAGFDLAELRAAANKPGFKPVPMKATFSGEVKNIIRQSESQNVLGLLKGSERPDEIVVYTAHWDHLGRNPQKADDNIHNGAIDNATGVAGVLEIAERFVTQPEPPKRSVLFMFVTLEESGLLGSRYYVDHPVYPANKTVAALNIDALRMIGKTRDMVVVGLGASELEDILRPVAEQQGRVIHAESTPEKGSYYRSDHFNFAKVGVPALDAQSGLDHIEKGEAYGQQMADDYTNNRYHQPSDEFDPNWDMAGAMDDLNALFLVGNQVARSEAWPNWYVGNEFRAIRDRSLAAPAAQ